MLITILALASDGSLHVYRKSPYLIFGRDDSSMVVLWQLYRTQESIFQWGTDTTYSLGTIVSREYNDLHQHKVKLTGLIPGRIYHYRVITDGVVKKGTFRAKVPSDDTTLTFYVYGDTRTYPLYHDSVAAAIVRDFMQNPSNQTFIISTGDLITDGGLEESWDEEFFNPDYPNIQKMLAHLPYMSATGNHEGRGFLFRLFFPYEMDVPWQLFYSFDAGPAHFVVLDQYVYYLPGSFQYQWLEEDLSRTTKPWKFIVLHEPGWSAGPHSDEEAVKRYIQPLARKMGVKVILAGHNHNYSRAVVDGIHHITAGGGGAPLYDPDTTRPNLVKVDKSHHFVRVSINGRKIKVTAIRADGSIIEEFTDSLPSKPAPKRIHREPMMVK